MVQSDAPGVVPSRIRELLVFGDSLSDGGNARALLGDGAFSCPPHWANRRCDGPIWVDHLAVELGLPPPVPSTAGGSNHAHGGARSGGGATIKGLPNLLTQVKRFAGARGPLQEVLKPDTLAVVRAGANDYLDAKPTTAVADTVNRHLLIAVHTLADQGLRQFLVPSELPWGSSLIERPGMGVPQRQALNALIAQQNAALREGLADLARRRDLTVVQPDAHGLFLEIQADPAAWGFREIGRPALAAELGDSGFLWWDAWGHLTSAFHRLLAGLALRELGQAGLIGPATHNERSYSG
ncbi:MAG: SGNH/GDSL hydrolase family protein [Cyanobacteriota bacterium]